MLWRRRPIHATNGSTTVDQLDHAQTTPIEPVHITFPVPPATADFDRSDPALHRPLTLRTFIDDLWHTFFRTGVTGLATQFAYSLLFAAFPVLILVMSLAALADRVLNVPVASTLRDLIARSAPVVLKDLLDQLVEKAITQANTGVVSVSAAVATVLAIWGASGAIGALIAACGRAYGVKTTRSFPIRRLVNALLAVIIVVLIVAAASVFVFGEEITRRVTAWIGHGSDAQWLAVIPRWSLFVMATMLALVLLYKIGTDLDLSVPYLLPGASAATLLWLLLLKGFSALLEVTNPGDPYGGFASVVILLWFFYLTGVAFMFGAVLNAVISRPYDSRRRDFMAEHPEKRMYCPDGREG